MNPSLQQQLVALGFVITKQAYTPSKAEIEWCRRNVVRTNCSGKLSYCKPR